MPCSMLVHISVAGDEQCRSEHHAGTTSAAGAFRTPAVGAEASLDGDEKPHRGPKELEVFALPVQLLEFVFALDPKQPTAKQPNTQAQTESRRSVTTRKPAAVVWVVSSVAQAV